MRPSGVRSAGGKTSRCSISSPLPPGSYSAPPNISVDGYAVYTNNVPCGAFRGFGAPQAHFAAESMVTRLAHALGIDPIEMRRRNIYREGSIEPTQQPLPPGVSALPVLERCVQEAQRRGGFGGGGVGGWGGGGSGDGCAPGA